MWFIMESIIKTILTALYFAAPGLIANMSPILGKNILKSLAKPIDFRYKFCGRRLFGDHKTIRGFLLAIFTGGLLGFVQYLIRDISFFSSISYINYTLGISILIGAVFGFAALFGDAVKSFFKRQLDIPPGKPFIPFDQMDYVIGIILFSFFFKPVTWQMALALIIVIPFVTVLFTKIGYSLKLREEKW
jgi:CDP-2,3-bis-(O-geranylgeranyl)-sn-glycerol synthase